MDGELKHRSAGDREDNAPAVHRLLRLRFGLEITSDAKKKYPT